MLANQNTLTDCHRQWATRPADERFLSLHALQDAMARIRETSRAKVVSTRALRVVPTEDNRGLAVTGANGVPFAPTNWAFGQLATLAESPAGYLRTLPAPLAADCLNWQLGRRSADEVGVLIRRDGDTAQLRAATGPKYGRIFNDDIAAMLADRFGDGVTGDWRVPGVFGKQVAVDHSTTTIYGGDRDMFVFLADEERRIEIPNRRDGKTGSMARGFFVSNSEVGAATLRIRTFLFDYVCANRIVGAPMTFRRFQSGIPRRLRTGGLTRPARRWNPTPPRRATAPLALSRQSLTLVSTGLTMLTRSWLRGSVRARSRRLRRCTCARRGGRLKRGGTP